MKKGNNIKCNICKHINEKGNHYCYNCGKNISDIIEGTDILFFFCGLMKGGGILLLVCFFPFFRFIDVLSSLNVGNKQNLSIYVIIFCLILIVGSFILKKYILRLCKKNKCV